MCVDEMRVVESFFFFLSSFNKCVVFLAVLGKY